MKDDIKTLKLLKVRKARKKHFDELQTRRAAFGGST